jgi:hypothetical protein
MHRTELYGLSFLGGLAGYLDVHRRPAACGVLKNLRQRSQADTDSWYGLFDTRAGPVAGVSSLSKKRAFAQASWEHHSPDATAGASVL